MTEDRRTFLKTAGATVVGAALAGCAGGTPSESSEGTADGTSESTTEMSESTETTDGESSTTTATEGGDVAGSVSSESNADLELTEHTFFQDGSTEGVRGTVTNTSETTYSLVVVHVNPESEDGETLGRFEADSSESIDTLEPDATWDFEVTFDGDMEFTQYTIWVTGQTEGDAGGSSGTNNSSNVSNSSNSSNTSD